MKCSRCDIDLPRGSAHVSEAGCIEALKEKLEGASKCAACSEPVSTVIHPGCIPAEVANRGAKLGAKALEKRVTDWLLGKISDEGAPPREDRVDPMDRDQRDASRRASRRGGHFEP